MLPVLLATAVAGNAAEVSGFLSDAESFGLTFGFLTGFTDNSVFIAVTVDKS